MASRSVVIPFPAHRVRRPVRSLARSARTFAAQQELEELEHAQLKLFGWCFVAAALVTSGLAYLL